MRLSIRRNSDYIVDCNQVQIQGRNALGGYAFVLVLEGSSKPQEPSVSIINISVSLAEGSTKKRIAEHIPSSSQVLKCIYARDDESLCFEMLLGKEQLNEIEESRQEGDLELMTGLKAMVLCDGEGICPSYDATAVSIPRQQWLAALGKAGYRGTLLFEVPMPSFSDDLMRVVAKAQEFVDCGHYQDAVMQCRRIIERIEEMRGDGQKAGSASKRLQSNKERQEMSAEERLLCMREQIKNVCQLGAHGSEAFTRSQARAVLGATLALLAEPTIGFCEMTPELEVGKLLTGRLLKSCLRCRCGAKKWLNSIIYTHKLTHFAPFCLAPAASPTLFNSLLVIRSI